MPLLAENDLQRALLVWHSRPGSRRLVRRALSRTDVGGRYWRRRSRRDVALPTLRGCALAPHWSSTLSAAMTDRRTHQGGSLCGVRLSAGDRNGWPAPRRSRSQAGVRPVRSLPDPLGAPTGHAHSTCTKTRPADHRSNAGLPGDWTVNPVVVAGSMKRRAPPRKRRARLIPGRCAVAAGNPQHHI
jgi:hypothetical protein